MNHQPAPQAIAEAIRGYIRLEGRNPAGLLLGFNTYVDLCREFADCREFVQLNTPLSLPQLSEFYGIPITVDPQQEHRITLLNPGSCWDVAMEAITNKGKPGLKVSINPTSYTIREDVKRDLAIAKYSRLRDDYFPIGGWLG